MFRAVWTTCRASVEAAEKATRVALQQLSAPGIKGELHVLLQHSPGTYLGTYLRAAGHLFAGQGGEIAIER